MATKTADLNSIITSLDDSEQDVEFTLDYLTVPNRKVHKLNTLVKTLVVINDGEFDYSHDIKGLFSTDYYNLVVTGDGYAVKHFLKGIISL